MTDDRATMRGGLLNLLLAGPDATSSLLGNVFFMLARYPKIHDKLAEYIRAMVPGSDHMPSLEDLRVIKYL